jgi:negative regulator of flagellin synthesis FlgM
MKVDVNSLASTLSTALGAQAAEKNKPTAKASTDDRVTLGSRDTRVPSLTAQAMETPEIRQDKVEQIRQAINNGSYSLDPHAIADAMIKNGE